MDLTSSVRTDTLPAVASVLVPGAGALTPYVVLLLTRRPDLAAFLASHEATALLGGVLLSITAGFFVESAGSYIEYYIIDWRHRDRDAMMEKFWRYLRIAWTTEPTGQHYLRRLLAVFKFELNGLHSRPCGAARTVVVRLLHQSWDIKICGTDSSGGRGRWLSVSRGYTDLSSPCRFEGSVA